MRSTFNILFYVNKSKEKNGVVPVMGRVTINGTQSQFSCKKTIPLDLWDVKGNCSTEKCSLGYTLLWNLFVALGTKIYTDYCHIKRKTTLFLNLCQGIIITSIFLIIFGHRTPNVGQE